MISELSSAEIEAHLDNLTKPPGSLGRLERLAARLCLIQGTLKPVTQPRRLTVFAADHGVVAEGVSAWPSEVTSLMIRNIAGGGAASSVLAASSGTELELVDVGSLEDSSLEDSSLEDSSPANPAPELDYLRRKVRTGTRNLAHEPALEVDEWHAALAVGAERAHVARADGCRVVAAGEMGIGNTTSASCLAALLADLPAEDTVGRGAGADDPTLARKRAVVCEAVERARPRLASAPEAAMAAVGGLEIAAMAGFFITAHEAGLTTIVDGFITTAAALAAERLVPGTAASMIAAHRSLEPAHGAMLGVLGLMPMLEWDLRLGEGTGALLLMPMLDAAAALVGKMATFNQLGLNA